MAMNNPINAMAQENGNKEVKKELRVSRFSIIKNKTQFIDTKI